MPLLLPLLNYTAMKYNNTFYLHFEKNGLSPIYVCVTFVNDRLRYPIGYRIDKKNFPIYGEGEREKKEADPKYKMIVISQTAAKNSIGYEGNRKVKYNEINSRITDIDKALEKFFKDLEQKPLKSAIIEVLNKTCLKVEAEKKIETFWSTAEKFLELTDVTDLSRKQLKSALKHLKTFEGSLKYELTFDNVTGETLAQFEKWLKKDGTRGVNSISSILKRIQRFYSWAIKEEKQRTKTNTIKSPFLDYTAPAELYGTPIVLLKEERDLLLNMELDNERLAKVRDIFIFQCYCGARISDLMKLTKNNLHGDVLKYVPQKTAKETIKAVEIPLNEKAIQILNKYHDPESYLLPRMSDVEINRTLKVLFKDAGMNRPVEWLNPKTGVVEFVPLHEEASTHLARRTFTGLMYSDGIKDDIIGSMTGHSENSKAFTRYRAIDMDLKKEATKKQ